MGGFVGVTSNLGVVPSSETALRSNTGMEPERRRDDEETKLPPRVVLAEKLLILALEKVEEYADAAAAEGGAAEARDDEGGETAMGVVGTGDAEVGFARTAILIPPPVRGGAATAGSGPAVAFAGRGGGGREMFPSCDIVLL